MTSNIITPADEIKKKLKKKKEIYNTSVYQSKFAKSSHENMDNLLIPSYRNCTFWYIRDYVKEK